MSRAKGGRVEREIANVLQDLDCVVVRAGASGSGSDRKLPDLHAGHGGHSIAIEVKSGKRPSNLEFEEARRLHEFAIQMGSRPVVAVRYSGDRRVYFAYLGEVPRTGSQNVSVSGVSERFQEHCFAVVSYAEQGNRMVVDGGRRDFHEGVLS